MSTSDLLHLSDLSCSGGKSSRVCVSWSALLSSCWLMTAAQRLLLSGPFQNCIRRCFPLHSLARESTRPLTDSHTRISWRPRVHSRRTTITLVSISVDSVTRRWRCRQACHLRCHPQPDQLHPLCRPLYHLHYQHPLYPVAQTHHAAARERWNHSKRKQTRW